MTRLVTILLLVGSLGCSLWLIVGGFVSYAPSVSAHDIQNIYLAHIVQFGGASCALQAVAIVMLAVTGRTAAATQESRDVDGRNVTSRVRD